MVELKVVCFLRPKSCEKMVRRKVMSNRMPVHTAGQFAYDIIMESSFQQLPEELKVLSVRDRKLCIVTDSNVAELYLEEVRLLLLPCCKEVLTFVFPAGEENKNLNTVRDLYEFLIVNHVERKDMLVALGGGVVGDLCGFAAATYLRGISFIQVPTTLLSQVDSSIGGKTGVDFDAYKNMVGAFHMPKLVYSNTAALLTLSEDQFSSGMGEIIKHGLIRSEEYYAWLLDHAEEIKHKELDICQIMIWESNKIKREVVEKDPTEQGDRALLNFGHTLGHAIEKCKDFKMLHGHCVGIGCLAAAEISACRGMISEEEVLALRQLLNLFAIPVTVDGLDYSTVIETTKNDKKMDSGIVKFILLQKIGSAYVDKTVSNTEMERGLSEILV